MGIDVVVGKWGRLRGGENSENRGWLRTPCLSEVAPKESGQGASVLEKQFARPPEVVVESPTSSQLYGYAGQTLVKGQIRYHPLFPHQQVASMIFVGGQKVWFDVRHNPEADLVTIPFEVMVELESGSNRVSIRAVEKKRVEIVETFFIHRATEPVQ